LADNASLSKKPKPSCRRPATDHQSGYRRSSQSGCHWLTEVSGHVLQLLKCSFCGIKTILVDGRLWFSKARDLKEFKRRQARAKAIVQIYFEHWDVRYLPA